MNLTSGASRVLAVVPARYASTRFPGKVIAPILGRPMILWTYEQACKATLVDEVLVATDAPEVVDALAPYGVTPVMTRADHACGTDRIAEVAASVAADIIVNVQGDEPLIDPAAIDATIRPLLEQPDVVMSTARVRITDWARVQDPNVVKVICDERGRALYFSRSPIPYIRDEKDRGDTPACYWQHVGLYAYRRDFLLAFSRLPQTPLEKLEKLEQLRALENGHRIAVVETEYVSIGVDVREDLEQVNAYLKAQRKEQ